jgi:hypothetical protein
METILAPHSELDYEQVDISTFKGFDWSKGTKADAVAFARAKGFKETGMSVNEIALLYDLLERKKPKTIVELGRNFGCSTRLFMQHVIRHGGSFESWDLKHWDGFLEKMAGNGYIFQGEKDGPRGKDFAGLLCLGPDGKFKADDNIDIHDVEIRLAHSIKTAIPEDFIVDFLLIDTEHGIEHALGEYMRWREYCTGGSIIAFHDSTLPAVARAIDLALEVEEISHEGRVRWVHKNERIDGYGIAVLEWVG